jgi:type I protein arginine methyltransferase
MYSLSAFGAMIADSGRSNAYAEAIAAAVRPGDVVADIGCGPGLLSFLACRAGARRVFAIEADDSIQVARELAVANGLANIIEFHQSDSSRTELPERVNVIVADVRGVLPLYRDAIALLEDAKHRFLVPGGILIPQRDVLKAALVEAPQDYSEFTSPWQKTVAGLDLRSPISQILNQLHKASFRREQLLTAPLDWGVLDYAAGAQSRAAAELHFDVTRGGTVHGICVWFEATLFGNKGYSTQPGTPSVYGQMFLPWLKPVNVEEGSKIHVELHADLVIGEYIWRWNTKIPETSGHPAMHFAQSTFQGAMFSLQSLRRQEVNHKPSLSEAGQAELWILERMTGDATLQSIAQGAFEQFPGLFTSWQAAFDRVAELSKRLSR